MVHLTLRYAPYTPSRPGQIVVKVSAVGIDHFDWVLQYQGSILGPHLNNPTLLGCNVARDVLEVGPNVKCSKVGDRVVGSAVCIAREPNSASEGAFQLYTVMRLQMVALVPDHIADKQAPILELGLGTAAYGFFQKE